MVVICCCSFYDGYLLLLVLWWKFVAVSSMVVDLFSFRHVRLTKWSFSVYSTMRNAPYVHARLDSIFESYLTFPIVCNQEEEVFVIVQLQKSN